MTAAILALLFVTVSQINSLPPGLLGAICYTESKYDVSAVNPDDGAGDSIGVCQLHYTTAVQMGYHGNAKGLKDPKVNIRYAGRYLAWQLHRSNGDILHSIAAYNTGSIKFNKHGQVVNKAYVTKVLTEWQNPH